MNNHTCVILLLLVFLKITVQHIDTQKISMLRGRNNNKTSRLCKNYEYRVKYDVTFSLLKAL